MRALLALALCSCSVLNVAQHRKPPAAAYALDFAAFSLGMAAGIDAQYRSGNEVQMVAGYGVAAAMWMPWMILGR